MHWKTELEGRIANSTFTRLGVISAKRVAIRRFDTPLMPDNGWSFYKGGGKGWSGPHESKAHAHAELVHYLLDEEDMLVRALTGVADFSHTSWLKPRRGQTRAGNDGVQLGYYRFVGSYVHVIRFHDGFISVIAVNTNRIERKPLPSLETALKESDNFMILKVGDDSIAEVVALNPRHDVSILPATIEEEGLFGVTAQSIREAIEMLDGLDHEMGDE